MSTQLNSSDSALATQLSAAEMLTTQLSSQSTTTTTTTQSPPSQLHETMMLTETIQSQHLTLSSTHEHNIDYRLLINTQDANWSKCEPTPPMSLTSNYNDTMNAAKVNNHSIAYDAALKLLDDYLQTSLHFDPIVWNGSSADDGLICCYHDVVLRGDDLQLLLPGQWLNDTWIEFFYE
ncbi:hypothetical protein BDF19DRAFT_450934 [Syncephalis fuscata]|nr:hypothetical protein BDF19DRAFT_450934 [Syncephalis fuscata]